MESKVTRYTIERVYKSKEYLQIFKDVIEDIIMNSVHFSKDERQYDRKEFMRVTSDFDLGYNQKDRYQHDIHTIGLLFVQMVEDGKIYYNNKKENVRK
tara:strand:+ start:969 stop:1262 length:294 start_codon:yes stop_codon:yes gene_type:complete